MDFIYSSSAKLLKQNTIWNKNILQSAPAIKASILDINNYYTLIMIDIDAPRPSKNTSSPFLHWIISDLNTQKNNKNLVICPYFPPSPPYKNEPHRYEFRLYKQKQKLLSADELHYTPNFDIDKFIAMYDLEYITKNTIKVIY
jgi:phosphatidylethanolamine-binding protein (PEBP) family uncharacterized protein